MTKTVAPVSLSSFLTGKLLIALVSRANQLIITCHVYRPALWLITRCAPAGIDQRLPMSPPFSLTHHTAMFFCFVLSGNHLQLNFPFLEYFSLISPPPPKKRSTPSVSVAVASHSIWPLKPINTCLPLRRQLFGCSCNYIRRFAGSCCEFFCCSRVWDTLHKCQLSLLWFKDVSFFITLNSYSWINCISAIPAQTEQLQILPPLKLKEKALEL